MAEAVLSAIGHDRPGLVSDITSDARAHGLNITDSRMTALGSEFAVLMAVTGEPEALAAFEVTLRTRCESADDLTYLFRPTERHAPAERLRSFDVSVMALDHPGIVAAIASFFADRAINIRDLQTEASPAAHTGTPIFSVAMVVDAPESVRVNDLKDAFDAFCADADLDGALEARR